MIDYEKLLIDLQDKVDDLRWRMNAVCNFLNLQYPDLIDNVTALYMKEEIQELKQPEPKYKPGDEVWMNCWSVADANRHEYDFIRGFVIPNRDYDKNLSEPYVRINPCSPTEGGEYSRPERFVYRSLEALIESQIEYWQSLQQPEENQSQENEPYKILYKPKINDEALQKFLNGFAYKQNKENCVHLASPYSPVGLLEPCEQKCIKCGEFY